jgi:hypothetical protein
VIHRPPEISWSTTVLMAAVSAHPPETSERTPLFARKLQPSLYGELQNKARRIDALGATFGGCRVGASWEHLAALIMEEMKASSIL